MKKSLLARLRHAIVNFILDWCERLFMREPSVQHAALHRDYFPPRDDFGRSLGELLDPRDLIAAQLERERPIGKAHPPAARPPISEPAPAVEPLVVAPPAPAAAPSMVDPPKTQPVVISEGHIKKNLNPPPVTPRPASPKAQTAAAAPKKPAKAPVAKATPKPAAKAAPAPAVARSRKTARPAGKPPKKR